MRASDRRWEPGAPGHRTQRATSPASPMSWSANRHRTGAAPARRNGNVPEARDALTARCADGHGTLTPLFFSDHLVDIARAKAICGKCALRELCLADALERGEAAGVWGAELLSEGRIVAVKRPNGRPPKHPRPELVVDEMGVVDDVAAMRRRPGRPTRTGRGDAIAGCDAAC